MSKQWTDEHIGRLIEQRDQARAEIERLRAALTECLDWEGRADGYEFDNG